MNEIAATDLGRPVDVVLIDGDVDPVVVEKETASRKAQDPIIQYLDIVDGTR